MGVKPTLGVEPTQLEGVVMIEQHPNGTLLGKRYEIVKLLGRGNFGLVYRARDQLDGQPNRICVGQFVAIKQMPMQMIIDCERQADLRAMLVHPAHLPVFLHAGLFAPGHGADRGLGSGDLPERL